MLASEPLVIVSVNTTLFGREPPEANSVGTYGSGWDTLISTPSSQSIVSPNAAVGLAGEINPRGGSSMGSDSGEGSAAASVASAVATFSSFMIAGTVSVTVTTMVEKSVRTKPTIETIMAVSAAHSLPLSTNERIESASAIVRSTDPTI